MTEQKQGQKQKTLVTKLSAIMGKAKRFEKTGRNDYQKYDYVEADAIFDFLRGAMAEQDVLFLPRIDNMDSVPSGKDGKGRLLTLHFTFSFLDGGTGETIETKWIGEAADSSDKAINKAITAGIKYFFMRFFLLSGGNEGDADQHSPEVEAPSVDLDAVLDAIAEAANVKELQAAARMGKMLGSAEDKAIARDMFAKKREFLKGGSK